jgi:hypothetical protein
MIAEFLFVALLAQERPSSYFGTCPATGAVFHGCVSDCTVGPVAKSPDAPLYYLCLNAHHERVTVEHKWFIEHCSQTNARDETEFKIAAFCNAYAPRFGPLSDAGRDQSKEDPAKPREPFSSKLKRWGTYALGALITAIYIYSKSQ